MIAVKERFETIVTAWNVFLDESNRRNEHKYLGNREFSNGRSLKIILQREFAFGMNSTGKISKNRVKDQILHFFSVSTHSRPLLQEQALI